MLFVILTFCLTTITAHAAYIDTSAAPSEYGKTLVPFYKTKESKFPSGYTTFDNLKKKQVRRNLLPEKYYSWNQKLFPLMDLNPIFPAHLANNVIDPITHKRLKVLNTNISTLFATDPNKPGLQTKYPINEVNSDAYDSGLAMALKDLYLKKNSSAESPVITTIPQGERLIPLNYHNGYAEVRYKNYLGYVSLSEVITKYDFCTYAYFNNQWHPIKSRQYDYLIDNKKQKIHLSKITGLIVNDQLGIIGSNSQKIPMWSQVNLINNQQKNWSESRLKDHGLVWWRPDSSSIETYYSIDDLLKKEIASVSYDPKNPLQGILSSHGVYITENGTQWKKIEKFNDYHGPVHYFSPALIFVGNYRSIDGGKTFDNYIQLDRLAHMIEDQYGFYPKKLQVKKIETFKPYRMKIELDTGNRQIKLESPLFAQDWKPSKG